MIHFLHMRDKVGPDKAVTVLGTRGDIDVIVSGKQLDSELVELACLLAKKAKCMIHLIYLIEVPRTLPLAASIKKETQQAEIILTEALILANGTGCDAEAEVVHVRDAAAGIVDEAKDHHCALIVLSQGANTDRRAHNDIGKVIPYVLTHATCRVWVVHDQQPTYCC